MRPKYRIFLRSFKIEREYGIAYIQLGLATLEEVFLNIARQAELEAATAEGRLFTLTLPSGASVRVKNTTSFLLFLYTSIRN